MKPSPNEILENVTSSLEDFFEPRGIKPTLRTIFYRLYSLGVIPNTKGSYQKLGKILVEARKDGTISWEAFSDGAKREVLGDYEKANQCIDPTEEAQALVNWIAKIRERPEYKIGRWYNQPKYVEVWIEKDAMSSTFQKVLEDREVPIVVNKGYSSWTFLYNNAQRLLQHADKEIHILYFGDFDPSGLDMEEGHLADGLNFFGLDVDFHRISVSLDHIKKYKLPELPSERETIDKAKRDPRLSKFMAEYGRLILVELDAMLAVVPDEFISLIQDSVDKYFDEDIYQETLKLQTKNAEIKRQYLFDHTETK
jgi:hypothetical protein